MFDINFQNLLKRALPWFLRTDTVLALTKTFAKPLKDINQQLQVFRQEQIDVVSWNTQIVNIEYYLNRYYGIPYDPATRAADIASGTIIWIEDGPSVGPSYLYNKSELHTPPDFFKNLSEGGAQVFFNNTSEFIIIQGFIINVPVAVIFNETILRNLVDFYNLADKTYLVQTYV